MDFEKFNCSTFVTSTPCSNKYFAASNVAGRTLFVVKRILSAVNPRYNIRELCRGMLAFFSCKYKANNSHVALALSSIHSSSQMVSTCT